MAKKQRQQHALKPKEFHVTPFGALKGVAVSETEQVLPPQSLVQKKTESLEEEVELFLQAVEGVRPIQRATKKTLQEDSPFVRKVPKKNAADLLPVEENAFLEEVGRLKLDTKFADSAQDDGELQPLAGNRLRQAKRGVISVSHQLDLHGLTREEALDALPGFLHSAQKNAQKAVLIITGKGNHSSKEPVLHQAVASWLRDTGRATVLEFAPAPREMGGSGAYVVFLRQMPPTGLK